MDNEMNREETLENEETLNSEAEAKEENEVENEPEANEEAEAKEETSDSETEEAEAKEDTEKKPKERELKWAKKKNKEPKVDPLDEANDKYKRLLAEFENFRTRSEKEKSERYDMGAKSVIEKILPIMDNFERGFATIEDSDKDDAFVKGMDMVYKQFEKALEDLGVTPIEAVGKEFDPELHNAVMHVDDPEVGDNIVVEELMKGYMYKDKVVRYSMVKVAN